MLQAGARGLGERRGSSACDSQIGRESAITLSHEREEGVNAHQSTHGRLSANSTPSVRALRERDWLTLAAHSNLTTCWITSVVDSHRVSLAPTSRLGLRARTVEEADLAARVHAPLVQVRLELERDDEHGAVHVRVGRRERVVRRVGVHDVRADLDGAADMWHGEPWSR